MFSMSSQARNQLGENMIVAGFAPKALETVYVPVLSGGSCN